MIKFTHDMGLRILLSILDSFWKTIFGGSIFGVPSVALSAQTMGQQVPDLTGRYFSIFLTHDMGINDQIYKWVWTDTMGINDQIYTWHGTQDIIVDFGFILENNFWRFHFWGAICGPVRPDNGTAGPWPNGQVFFNFLTHDMGINDQIYTWDGTQGIIVGFGFILFFLGGSIFGVPSVILLPKMAPEKKWRQKKNLLSGRILGKMAPQEWRFGFRKKHWDFCPTVWTYIGEDCAQRMGIWFQKKLSGISVLQSGRILGKMAPQEWTFGFRTIFRDLLSHCLGG